MNKIISFSLCFLLFNNIISLEASTSTTCEMRCFFECLFVASPCKTDNCPCPDVDESGNPTNATTTVTSNSTTLSTDKTVNETLIESSLKDTGTSSFTLKSLVDLLLKGSSDKAIPSLGNSNAQTNKSSDSSASSGSNFDYSQYVSGSGSTDNSTGASNGTNSGSYDYSAYNTEPATIPTNPTIGFNYSTYYKQPTTIPKGGAV